MIKSLMLAAALAVIASPAFAQTGCFDFIEGWEPDRFQLAEVKKSVKRAYFITESCPTGEGCDGGPFIVGGDPVLVDTVNDASACVGYVNRKGVATFGLIANDKLGAPAKEPSTNAAGLIGQWKRIEADISITRDEGDWLTFEGEATYGALDPERVKNGGVNEGGFAFRYAPADHRVTVGLVYVEGGDGGTEAKPPDAVGEYDCKLDMLSFGPYLAVQDNRSCGGANVSFSGLYRRIK
jgi:hypothetical protein